MIEVLAFGSLAIAIGAYTNILGIMHPAIITQATQVSKVEKIKSYAIVSSIVYIIPLLLNLFVFLLYEKSRKRAIIDREYYKNKKWWEL